MSSQVIRVPNGGSIQVRSGVLRGIGPAGPVGPVGPQGPQGDKGDQGNTGATGSVNDVSSMFALSTPVAVGANTDTIVPLDFVWWDSLQIFTSSTAFTFGTGGSYLISGNLTIAKGGPDALNGRKAFINQTAGGTTGQIFAVDVGADPKNDTLLAFSFARLFSAGDVIQLKVRHSDTISLSVTYALLTVYKIGAGPAGATGAMGPTGPVGPIGPQGPTGPAGNASSGFATYEDLRP